MLIYLFFSEGEWSVDKIVDRFEYPPKKRGKPGAGVKVVVIHTLSRQGCG
jgi:hypothetical protein